MELFVPESWDQDNNECAEKCKKAHMPESVRIPVASGHLFRCKVGHQFRNNLGQAFRCKVGH